MEVRQPYEELPESMPIYPAATMIPPPPIATFQLVRNDDQYVKQQVLEIGRLFEEGQDE